MKRMLEYLTSATEAETVLPATHPSREKLIQLALAKTAGKEWQFADESEECSFVTIDLFSNNDKSLPVAAITLVRNLRNATDDDFNGIETVSFDSDVIGSYSIDITRTPESPKQPDREYRFSMLDENDPTRYVNDATAEALFGYLDILTSNPYSDTLAIDYRN